MRIMRQYLEKTQWEIVEDLCGAFAKDSVKKNSRSRNSGSATVDGCHNVKKELFRLVFCTLIFCRVVLCFHSLPTQSSNFYKLPRYFFPFISFVKFIVVTHKFCGKCYLVF